MPFLDWVNKNQAKQVAGEVSYHLLKQEDIFGEIDGCSADNLVIHGDNLVALKALMPFYSGRIKCIFIDPPYNTQSAFEQYDDKLEHSQWLSMIFPRLVLLRQLLENNGSIWITIDDNESHYLKVMMDEIFGRSNFVGNVIWQKKFSPQNDAKWLSDMHDHVLVYAKDKSIWRPNKLLIEGDSKSKRGFNDDDERGEWISVDYTCNKNSQERPNLYYPVINPNTGEEIWPKETAVWRFSKDRHEENVANNLVYWGRNGTNKVPRFKNFKSIGINEIVPTTLWLHQDVGNTQEAKKEVTLLNPNEPFSTPKPERLLKRILEIATQPGDLVLDSFLGSATTTAVAHKMNRGYIGIEMGPHVKTHCIPRMTKVVEGELGGISQSVGWTGGGGFRFCTLGNPVFDDDGRISPDIDFATLAAFVWHFETGTPGVQAFDSPKLGVRDNTAYYLLFSGILGDRQPAGGNVLTHDVLKAINEIFPHSGPKVIYGEISKLGSSRLAAENITFKQIPYDVKMR